MVRLAVAVLVARPALWLVGVQMKEQCNVGGGVIPPPTALSLIARGYGRLGSFYRFARAASTWSFVNGIVRSRMPAALKIALPIAAGTTSTVASPAPQGAIAG